MRKASKILGIIGGSLALAVPAIIVLSFFVPRRPMGFVAPYPSFLPDLFEVLTFVYIFLSIAVCILGITGGLLVPKKSKTAGILMLVGAGLSLFCSNISMVLLVIGGVFALQRDKNTPPNTAPEPPSASYGDSL